MVGFACFFSLTSSSWLSFTLSLKSSNSFFFLSGDDSDGEGEVLFWEEALFTPGVPKAWWIGVLPRDGVKSAIQEINNMIRV